MHTRFLTLAAFATFGLPSAALADSITLGSGDIGSSFSLNYNGFTNGTTIQGLTGSSTFTLTGISGNNYTFNYSVNNTTSAPVTDSRSTSSRVSCRSKASRCSCGKLT